MIKLQSVSEIAKETGTQIGCLRWAIQINLLPQPIKMTGDHAKKWYYTEAQANRLKKLITTSTIKDEGDKICSQDIIVAKKITHHRLQQMINDKQIPQPKKIGRKFFWSDKQFAEIMKMTITKKKQKKEPSGYHGVSNSAKYLKMPRITFQSWRENGSIPAEEKVEGWFCPLWSIATLEKIKEIKADYFKNQTT